MGYKPLVDSFAPLLENTPPIDTRFVYDNLLDFERKCIFHHSGCISYIKNINTFIKIESNGDKAIAAHRVGVMDLSVVFKMYVSKMGSDSARFDTAEVQTFVDRLISGNIDHIKIDDSTNNYVINTATCGRYDIVFDFANNIYCTKYIKNYTDPNDYTKKTGKFGVFFKFDLIDQHRSVYLLDKNIKYIYGKLNALSTSFNSAIDGANSLEDLKNVLKNNVFSTLNNLDQLSSISTNAKMFGYEEEVNENSGKDSEYSSSNYPHVDLNALEHL